MESLKLNRCTDYYLIYNPKLRIIYIVREKLYKLAALIDYTGIRNTG